MDFILFIIFIGMFFILYELTYQVAVHQQLGMVRFISAGGMCWINRIILIIPCIRFFGWIFGILISIAAILTLTHLTIGWIFALPSIFIKDDYKLQKYVDVECGMLIPANIIALIMAVGSFFVTYKIGYEIAKQYIIPIAIIFAVGFIIRFIVSKIVTATS